MRSINTKPDFSDPQPAFQDMSDEQLRKRYVWFKKMGRPFFPWLSGIFAQITRYLPEWSYKWVAKRTIFKFFVGGESLKGCQRSIDILESKGIGSIPELSVESAGTEAKVESAMEEIFETINLSQRNRKKIPFTVFKITGLIKKKYLISIDDAIRLGTELSPRDRRRFDSIVRKADQLCGDAYRKGVRIMIDAEETWIQNVIDRIAITMMQRYNKERVVVINTYQLYLREGLSRLRDNYTKSRLEGFRLGAKVVRGAYMEKENAYAMKNGTASPVHSTKEATDKDYNLALEFCIEQIDTMVLVAGTHNKSSIQLLMHLMEDKGLPRNCDNIYFSQLFGMGDILSYNLSKFGYNVCKYLPFGPVKQVIPYLVRRARENSSVRGFTSRELQTIKNEMARRGISIN